MDKRHLAIAWPSTFPLYPGKLRCPLIVHALLSNASGSRRSGSSGARASIPRIAFEHVRPVREHTTARYALIATHLNRTFTCAHYNNSTIVTNTSCGALICRPCSGVCVPVCVLCVYVVCTTKTRINYIQV